MAHGIELKSREEIVLMRRAGLVVARTLTAIGRQIAPGMTTREVDQIARDMLAEAGAGSSFLNYGGDMGYPPFPGVTCVSVNDEIVHGIPGDRVLADGDLVSVDFGAIVDGWHGDAARTFAVGDVAPELATLSSVTEQAMWAGIGALRVGGTLGDVGHAIEQSVRRQPGRHGIVREYTGHGIGTDMHQDPDVPNVGRRGRGPRVVEGLVVAIEPMVTNGKADTATLDDEWTVVTRDRSAASHWENTVTATKQGLWVLTLEDGGEAELTRRRLPFAPLAD